MTTTLDLSTAPDEELGRRLRDGDEGAFTALYERYSVPIHDFLVRTMRDSPAAEDVTQATFLQAWTKRDGLQTPAAVKGWLYRIAHNIAMNHVTRTKATDELDENFDVASPGPTPEEVAVTQDMARLVWDAAASLEPRQYTVLDLSVRRQFSSAEVGDILGVSPEHASVLVNRAREALGNSVRILLVARRRTHCERLAEMVPAGVRQLTPEQRKSVDYHMRRCENCRGVALLLTRPAEIFGALAVLPMPARIANSPPVTRHAASSVARPAVANITINGPRPHIPRSRPPLVAVVATGTAVLASVAIGVVIATTHHVPSRAAVRPAPTSSSGLSRTPSGVFAGSTMAPMTGPALTGVTGLYGVSCPTTSTCFAVGATATSGVVLVSHDAGRSWSAVLVPGTSWVAAVSCSAASACVLVGSNGSVSVAVTSVDGRSWTVHSIPTDVAPVSTVACPTPDDCIVAATKNGAASSPVAVSHDGGHTWSEARPVPGLAQRLFCSDAQHCWAVGGSVWFSADFGRSWTEKSPPNPGLGNPACVNGPCPPGPWSLLLAVHFADAMHGVVIGGEQCGGMNTTQCPGMAFVTTDGGNTWDAWALTDYDTIPFLDDLACNGSNCVVIAQTFRDSMLLTDVGGVWTIRERHIAGSLHALACTPEGRCIAVGTSGSQGVLLSGG
jgi:RNA polymerase sigma factor (sigma-70 family)